MLDFPILSFTIFLPIIGIIFIYFLARGSEKRINSLSKIIAFSFSILTLILSIVIIKEFDKNISTYQFVENLQWLSQYNISYHLGIDGISVYFILLTAILIPICILSSWESIINKPKEYMILFLLMESMIIGVFCALDFVLFYIFFEAILIPMFIIIGVWGSDQKIYAAFKFFLYTLAGSLLLLLAIIYLYMQFNTSDIEEITKYSINLPLKTQKFLWLMMFASFAVKIPMVPFHTWLPDAHVQAPTAGSVILAGILLKMGAYGFLRFSLPMLPAASEYFAFFIITLSVIAIIYASIVAIMQSNMKKLIAYSSIAHMGFVTIGIFTFEQIAIEGAIFQMISHGIVSAALFLCVGVVYDRMHTKEISAYGGVVNVMPRYALYFMIFLLASIGFPGVSGFVGEIMVLIGMFYEYKIATFLAATGMIFGAIYMLWLYKRLFFGEITNKHVASLKDLTLLEKCYFMPLLLLTIILGIYPSYVTDILNNTVSNLVFNIIAR